MQTIVCLILFGILFGLLIYEFWGYNPPFTLPMFRRNEIWIQLDTDQVDYLINKFWLSKF